MTQKPTSWLLALSLAVAVVVNGCEKQQQRTGSYSAVPDLKGHLLTYNEELNGFALSFTKPTGTPVPRLRRDTLVVEHSDGTMSSYVLPGEFLKRIPPIKTDTDLYEMVKQLIVSEQLLPEGSTK